MGLLKSQGSSRPTWWSTANMLLIRSATTHPGASGLLRRCDNTRKGAPGRHWWRNAFCALSKANRRGFDTRSVRMRSGPLGCAASCLRGCSNAARGAISIWMPRNRMFLKGSGGRCASFAISEWTKIHNRRFHDKCLREGLIEEC